MKHHPLRRVLLASALLGLAVPALHAQAWPQKPIRIVVTFAPGGSSDIVARLLQPGLQEKLGQVVIVENKPGAGSTIGANEVARAAPDGYTLLLSNTAPISISPFMMDKAPYDPVRSFSHVAYIGSVPNVFVVHPSVPARTLPDLVKWINAQPKPVNYGSGGVGSIGHIVGEMFKQQYKLNMEHVPYKGSSPMHNDLLGGTLQFAVDTLTQNVPYMKDGKLVGLAVTSRTRASMSPDVPSVVEAGYPKLVADNFLGVSAPAGTPADVVDKINKAVSEVVARPDVSKRLSDLGVDSLPMSAAQFTQFVTDQVRDWTPAVKASGARLN
ncbi:MAG: tripartite tricarboxylate transporter substrate binding protein [Hydrogenophaga sp.]|jgi:tripartite-type tricarboxylate transporter receptor subunit TctC|uniref:Bug family tripartite tricarboxylate transporter substrate binding protein n=1 Tax=Hydrogenophaga sp. TaxID=1904254 RepID=UPI00262DD673|nr:tripartite tricarboxylate transporter substrate binding protein [Hydrogenophaga sp.]MCV0440089.1 tripartite tricarboxylate transporter substrate binding protein [Hydrogenophaga sp.]